MAHDINNTEHHLPSTSPCASSTTTVNEPCTSPSPPTNADNDVRDVHGPSQSPLPAKVRTCVVISDKSVVADAAVALDIEHLPVADDPRLWSTARKNLILLVIAGCAMGGTLTASLVFPALEELQQDLGGSDAEIAATASAFIAGQGIFPVFWSALGEIKGRKIPYVAAILIYAAATAVASRATNMSVFIAMRVLQALGSGCVLVNGAGTLADIFDSHERGTKVGLFYAAPLVAPAFGPLLGGVLTNAANWRVTQYFLLGYAAVCLVLYIWLPETFRKERSAAWRAAMKRARANAHAKRSKARAALPAGTNVDDGQRQPAFSPLKKVKSVISLRSSGDDDLKIHLRDVNPLAATGQVLRCKENLITIAFSGLLFASQYCVTFTASRSFAAPPYNYDSLKVGLVLLTFGMGNLIGSVLGGRFSDYVFNKMRGDTPGDPEMRIRSTRVMLAPIPCLFIAYAWTVNYGIHVAGPIVILFFLGLATIWIYSSLLAYVVDANPGRSSSAVACNSLFRGVLACIASQVAEPIIDRLTHGWFYTGEGGLLIVGAKGKKWRAQTQARIEERDRREKEQQK
ncbi:hypothetical protein OIV83_002076 [Microbotryomycetes sp. JL201]|nr:hypothetical protein OIV83_002076 [Microbotryomycetes sp. JL201]